MSGVQPIVNELYRVSLGVVNAFVIARSNDLTLIDCGTPDCADAIELAIRQLGFELADLQNILITHHHPDHIGSLAEIQRRAPQAKTLVHGEEASQVREGIALDLARPLKATPGMHNVLLHRLYRARMPVRVRPARIDRAVFDGEHLNIAGGISVIHTPGHSLGHTSYLWRAAGGVMFVGDAACSMWGPRYSINYEDFELGKQSLLELAKHQFQYACFGHGRTIVRSAQKQFVDAVAQVRATRLIPAAELG